MTQTLTTERLREIAERRSPSLRWGEAEKIAAELLANREAQPVAYLKKSIIDSERFDSADPEIILHPNTPEGWLSEYQTVFTAPPAPAVPGIDELRLTFERAERESDDGFNLHKYGIGYADVATQVRWESWLACRSAMLAQPVSQGYKLVPIEPTEEMCNVQHIGVDVYTGMANDGEYYSIGGSCAAKVYRAMLAKSPDGGK